MQTILNKQQEFVVGVDLGGTKIAAALFDSEGRLLNREQVETAGARTAEEVVGRITAMIRSVSGGHPLRGVGMASPGAVNSREGIVIYGTNLPEWTNVPLKAWMERELSTEVQVLNDANAAAWGNMYAEPAQALRTWCTSRSARESAQASSWTASCSLVAIPMRASWDITSSIRAARSATAEVAAAGRYLLPVRRSARKLP